MYVRTKSLELRSIRCAMSTIGVLSLLKPVTVSINPVTGSYQPLSHDDNDYNEDTHHQNRWMSG